jgi:hypothetical protein
MSSGITVRSAEFKIRNFLGSLILNLGPIDNVLNLMIDLAAFCCLAADIDRLRTQPWTLGEGTMRKNLLLMLMILVPAGASGKAAKTPSESASGCLLSAGARYVAGYPFMPGKNGQPKQVRGRLLVDTGGIAFCSDYLATTAGWPLASAAPSTCDKVSCRMNELNPIPYENISLLARGRITESGGMLPTIADVAIPAVSLASLVASITTTGATRDWLIGGTLGTAGLAVALHELLVRRGSYIALFFSPRKANESQNTPCESTEQNSRGSSRQGQKPTKPPGGLAAKGTSPPPAKAPDLFGAARGCDLAVFQLFNPHDYWNVSTILNARTGLEFVSEAAEQK